MVPGVALNGIGLNRHLRARPGFARPEDRAPGIGRSGFLGELHSHLVQVGGDLIRIDRVVLAIEGRVRRVAGEHIHVVATDHPLVVDSRIDLHAANPTPSRLGK